MAGSLRLTQHPVLEVGAGGRKRVAISVNGRPVQVFDGENLAAALWANGIFNFREDENTGTPRGLYCGIGHCYECRVALNGVIGVRACLVTVREGMEVLLGSDITGGRDE